MRPSRLRLILLLSTLGCLLQPMASAADEAVSDAINQRMEELLFSGDLEIDGAAIAARELLPQIYASRNFLPLWHRDTRIQELLAVLDTAPDHGLELEDYYVDPLRTMVAQPHSKRSALDIADLDILLTESLIRFVYHQRFGKVNPGSLDANINFKREFLPGREPVSSIQSVVESPRPLQEQLHEAIPRGPVYVALQKHLAQYRAMAAAGGWPTMPAGPTLRPGDRNARVVALRQRLAVTGDLPASADLTSDLFDASLQDAVETFQKRHALASDGMVGQQSLMALNVPVQDRIDQIRLSLERLRWVQSELSEAFVVVNIAGFQVFLIRQQQLVWIARAMVGTPYRQTPVFRGNIRYLELNPTWTIPPGILSKDTLPAIKRDPNYLKRKRISVLDPDGRRVDPSTVNWQAYTTRLPYTLRQEPGPDNALGRIKFIFPNPHFVFLHDTPGRELFDRAERTFSSGCIRIENPLEFAELLLDDAQRWSLSALRQAVDSGKTQRLNLREPMPVLIVYLTATIEPEWGIRFLKDVYKRDPKLLQALNGDIRIELPKT